MKTSSSGNLNPAHQQSIVWVLVVLVFHVTSNLVSPRIVLLLAYLLEQQLLRKRDDGAPIQVMEGKMRLEKLGKDCFGVSSG